MKQAIVILLPKIPELEKIRESHVPDYKNYKPHISLVYTFEGVDQQFLEKHIKESIGGVGRFNITLQGLKKSAKEFYLYLLVDRGKIRF